MSRDFGTGTSVVIAIVTACARNFRAGNFLLQFEVKSPHRDGTGEEDYIVTGSTDLTTRFRCIIHRSRQGDITSLSFPPVIGGIGGKGVMVTFEHNLLATAPDTHNALVILDEETGIQVISNPRLRKLFAAVLELN